MGGEEDPFSRRIDRDRRRRAAEGGSLRPALQQVHLLAVAGEFDIDRRLEAFTQHPQQRRHSRHERRPGDQPLEVDDQLIVLEVDQPGNGPHPVVLDHRQQLAHHRHALAVRPQKGTQVDGLERAGLEIDHIDLLRCVAHRLAHRLVDAQTRLSRRHQHRVVVGQAVDRPRTEAGHQTQQSVFAPDPGRPAEFVVGERHAREHGQEVRADPLSHHLLDQDAHLLVHVEETPPRAVLERVGREDRGVDLGDGVGEGVQSFALGAGVGEKEALVLARERRAGTVFEQRRAAHDDRPAFEVVQDRRQAAQHLVREEGALEQLHQVRVLESNPFRLEILAVVDVREVVVGDEVENAVRRDVPAARNADVAQQVGRDHSRAGRSWPPGRDPPTCRRGGRDSSPARRCGSPARRSPRRAGSASRC